MSALLGIGVAFAVFLILAICCALILSSDLDDLE